MRRIVRLCATGALVASVVVALPGSTALAQTETVLTGVANGRGLTFDDDGNLYVASAGTGGEGPCIASPEGEGETCYGDTGAILRLDAAVVGGDAEAAADQAVLPDLPSTAPQVGEFAQGDASGPADVSVGPDGRVYFTIGLGADPAVRDGALEDATNEDLMAAVHSVAADGSDLQQVADLGAFEGAEDPDGEGPDTNPFGLVAGDGTVTVADSGGNTILEVATADGAITLGAVLPPTFVPAPPFIGAPAGTNIPAQAVPTGIAALDGGGFAVGQLTGFPFAPGSAGVWNYEGGTATPWYLGFTNIMDVAVGPDGAFYVLEIASDGLLTASPENPPMGSLIRVTTDGDTVTRELLVDDVLMPGGMAFHPTDGHVYMTTGSAFPTGDVVRFDVANAEPLLTVVDDTATTREDRRVRLDVADNDTGVTTVRGLGVSRGAETGSIVYQPPAHVAGQDVVAYEACNAEGSCLNGTVTVTIRATETDRIAGATRVRTAVVASQGRYPDGAPAVVIARADLYPDALAGGPLAAAVGGPILLTSSDGLDAATAAEIQRLGASRAWLLGGEAALSAEVEDAVGELVETTRRLRGADRNATAVRIMGALANVTDTEPDMAYVVEGRDADPNRGWPDAVAVSALASHTGRPILLVETDVLPDATAGALQGMDATVVGGSVAVSAAVEAAIDAAADTVNPRLAGATRYATSRAVADAARAEGMTAPLLTLVSGGNWPDALVAGPLVAGDSGSLLLVHPTDLGQSPETVAYVEARGPFEDIDILGGTAAISAAVEAGLRAAHDG
jgi:putative cell wall-binding protein/sugar lactone lactonase YvrE